MHACSDACVVLFGLVQSVSFALVIYKKLETEKQFYEVLRFEDKLKASIAWVFFL